MQPEVVCFWKKYPFFLLFGVLLFASIPPQLFLRPHLLFLACPFVIRLICLPGKGEEWEFAYWWKQASSFRAANIKLSTLPWGGCEQQKMIPHFKMKGKILRSSNIPANQNPAEVKERVCVCDVCVCEWCVCVCVCVCWSATLLGGQSLKWTYKVRLWWALVWWLMPGWWRVGGSTQEPCCSQEVS